MKNSHVKKLVLTALLAALTMVATLFIRIPLPLGYVNLGDAFVLLSALLLGPLYGTIAAGLGSALADLFGYITYAPGTLIIKSLMAIVAYCLYAVVTQNGSKRVLLGELLGGAVAAVLMAWGYFLYEILLFETAAVAIVNVPFNLLQGAVGVLLCILVMRLLIATKTLERLRS